MTSCLITQKRLDIAAMCQWLEGEGGGGGVVGQEAEYLGGGWRFLVGLSRAMLPVSLPLFLPALASALL